MNRTGQLTSLVSRCKVTVWHYVRSHMLDDVNENTEDYESVQYDDLPVIEFQFQKSIAGAPGEFALVFPADSNLLQKVKPGDWLAVYLTQGDTPTPPPSGPAGETPQPWTVGYSLENGMLLDGPSLEGLETTNGPWRGESKTYYWTPSQIEQWSQFRNPLVDKSASKNIMALAAAFDAKIRAGQILSDPLQSLKKPPSPWSLRCLGNVNRIARRESVSTNGVKSVHYVVTGYDFGKVFAATTIWFNRYFGEEIYQKFMQVEMMSSNSLKGTPGQWISAFLKLFLAPVGGNVPFTRITQQWHVPQGMMQLFPSWGSENLFYNILKQQFDPELNLARISTGYPSPINFWSLLSGYSHPQVNQLYYELDGANGSESPTLFLGMYPYAFKHYSDTTGSIPDFQIKKFLDLPTVSVDYSTIGSTNIGLSDLDRANLFFVYPTLDSENQGVPTAFSLKDRDVSPRLILEASLKRYGTRLHMDADEFVVFSNQGAANIYILAAVNLLIKHWFVNNQCLLNGVVELAAGNPNIRIGKRLVIDNRDSNFPYPQHYYITGYVDTWRFPGVWSQTVLVNRGIFVQNGRELFAEQAEDINMLNVGSTIIKEMNR